MPEPREIQSIIDAAEQAAAAGDYASAEQHLRKAATLQEASLGPVHPDLANTLNNLGIVCEIMEKHAEAERCFRRAWEIAKAALEPDHPFVATSRKNLEDFCKARGKPVDSPVAPPAPRPDRKAAVTSSGHVQHERASSGQPRPAAGAGWPRPLVIGVMIAVLIAAFVATPMCRSTGVDEAPTTGVSVPSPPPTPAPAAPATTPPPPSSKPIPSRAASSPSAAAAKRSVAGASAQAPIVVAARRCKDLSTRGDWECVLPNAPFGLLHEERFQVR
jgi:Tetratricopeptide repeat